MSSLVSHAERELRAAGYFDEDSDYGGLLGPAVLKMVEQFAEEGHSGFSAGLAQHLFGRVASYKLLTPIENPMVTGDYHDVSHPCGEPPRVVLQSTRLSSLFSNDSGKTWHDIDKKRTFWERLTRSRRAFVTFPYMPGKK